MKPIGKVLGTLCILLLAGAASTSWAALSASLDRDSVALGDTLRLTITATDDENLPDLDLRELTTDFEILGRSSNSKTSYVNGQFSSSNELVLDITPRREGTLAIPALRLGRQVTKALPVVVGPPPKDKPGDQALLFEAELDRSEVYVQGQVILTLRLQQAINLDDRNITQLQLDNAFVRPLEQNSFQRTIDGRPWLVHEVRYAIFPEQSGTLEIPAQTFSARERGQRRSLFDLGGGGRQIRRSSDALTIEVLPRPDGYPNAEWLPAAELTLDETWSTPPEQLKVGESATRTITIRGVGLQGAQLPPMLFPATDGLKFYPDQPTISDSELASGLIGTRVDSVAVVPTQAGNWQIPETRIPWWDTRSNQLRYAVLPARTLNVAAADPSALAPAPGPLPAPAAALEPGMAANIPLANDSAGRTWQLVSAITGTGWLLTLAYLLWSRGRPKSKPAEVDTRNPAEEKAYKELLAACASDNPGLARKSMVQWTSALTSRPDITSLAQAATAHDDPAMSAALDALNQALYSGKSSSWLGASLAENAKRLRASHRQAAGHGDSTLQLYPQLN